MGVANLRLDNQQGGGRCTSFHHKFHLMCQAPPSRPHRAAPVLHAQQAPQQPHPPAPSGCTDTAGAGAALCQELPAPAGTKALCAGPVAWLCLTMCPGEQEPPTACCSWGRREGRATQGQGITLQLYLPCEPSAAFSRVLLTRTIPSHSSQTSLSCHKEKYFIRNKAAQPIQPPRSHSTPVALHMLYLLSIHHSHPGRKQWPTVAVRFSLSSLKTAPRGKKPLAEGLSSQPSI